MKRFLPLLFAVVSVTTSTKEVCASSMVEWSHRHEAYFYWGYNRTTYSNSDIHFSGPDYDFTVYGAKAHDRPSKLGWMYIDPQRMSVPQYNYRFGYFLNKHLGVSFGMDHMKYVMDQNQIAPITGIVTTRASEKYAGTYFNQPVKLTEDVLRFEHTNGFNLFALELEYLFRVFQIGKSFSFCMNTGVGGVWLITKTDVHVFDKGMDNKFHLSGYALEAKCGARLEFWHNVFLTAEGKYGYATLPDVPIQTGSPERANHNLSFFEKYVVVGKYFTLGKREKSAIIP